jgi:hypothetical protein
MKLFSLRSAHYGITFGEVHGTFPILTIVNGSSVFFKGGRGGIFTILRKIFYEKNIL